METEYGEEVLPTGRKMMKKTVLLKEEEMMMVVMMVKEAKAKNDWQPETVTRLSSLMNSW